MGGGSGSRLDVEATNDALRAYDRNHGFSAMATAMMAVLTEPYTPGYFECPTCDRSDSAVVRFT
jgi:hypothetical protein